MGRKRTQDRCQVMFVLSARCGKKKKEEKRGKKGEKTERRKEGATCFRYNWSTRLGKKKGEREDKKKGQRREAISPIFVLHRGWGKIKERGETGKGVFDWRKWSRGMRA